MKHRFVSMGNIVLRIMFYTYDTVLDKCINALYQ